MLFETERLLIREFVPEDFPAVHSYASDPAVAEHMIWGPNSEEETKSYNNYVIDMQQKIPREGFEFAVVLRAGGVLIGGCGIHISPPRQGEIGYCFHREYWGKGFAAEAAARLIAFGFEDLGLHRIYATCRPGNKASARVMQKAGMTFEGHLREHKWHKGKWHDSCQYSILEQEYKKDFSE
ncbi:GNAT family N-acetyltransferase [Paenibacillus sp. PK3_47]|uniref:GNAT family N-acetyltransferase n=1 Tax=Paenibacillus sp. PK3_47 TaxID=2072642 RepID=UPI00201DEE82|nr:GNAT family protein [Paenibacillus sp. PK3_47]UQZ37410.1 GNAT family N-acetyltransferase [Paenibacillus sp. PK3_47]